MKYYVIYEYYTDYNQFEGSWDLQIEEFESLDKFKKWLESSRCAKDCITYNRKLIGPLKLVEK